MNRKINNKKQKTSPKVYMFWGAIILVTVAFFVVMGVKWYQASKVVTKMSGVSHVSGKEVFSLGEEGETYFVFFYTSNPESSSHSVYSGLVDNICEYVNFVNNYKGEDAVAKLYAYDVNTVENEVVLGTNQKLDTTNYSIFKVSESNLPVVIKYVVVKSGNDVIREYKSHYIGESAIEELFQQTMEKLK